MSSNSVVDWRNDRNALIAYFWNEGYAGKEIAQRVGGFEHCRNGGHNAVCGIAHRHRKSAGSPAEESFWSRGSGVHPATLEKYRAAAKPKRAEKTASAVPKKRHGDDRDLSHSQKLAIVRSIPKLDVIVTDAEVNDALYRRMVNGVDDSADLTGSINLVSATPLGRPRRTSQRKCTEDIGGGIPCGRPTVANTARCEHHGGNLMAGIRFTGEEPQSDDESDDDDDL